MIYDVRQVIARISDSSLFGEIMAHTGREMVTGIARINGLYVGIIANNQTLIPHPRRSGRSRPGGILYQEGIAKISAFSRACNDDGIPILWLQDISGFDIGPEAEREGLLGYGSNLIYTNSTNTVPMITVLMRKCSGAGYYAMTGLPYDPVIQLSTPVTRLSVMEGRTLSIGAYNTKLDDNFQMIPQKFPAVVPMPGINLALRWGIIRDLDVGVQVSFFPEVDTKYKDITIAGANINLAIQARYRFLKGEGARPDLVVQLGFAYQSGYLKIGKDYSFDFDETIDGTRVAGNLAFSGAPILGWDLFQITPALVARWKLAWFRPYLGLAMDLTFGHVDSGSSGGGTTLPFDAILDGNGMEYMWNGTRETSGAYNEVLKLIQ